MVSVSGSEECSLFVTAEIKITKIYTQQKKVSLRRKTTSKKIIRRDSDYVQEVKRIPQEKNPQKTSSCQEPFCPIMLSFSIPDRKTKIKK